MRLLIRRGFTTTETIIALVLLSAIVTSVGKFAAFASQGVRDRQLALHLQWELGNAREVIRSWPVTEVTPDRIEKLAISPELVERLENPRWAVTLTPQILRDQRLKTGDSGSDVELGAEIAVTAVHLQLIAVYQGQQIKPVESVFWILSNPNKPTNSDSSLQEQSSGEEVAP